MLWELPNQPNFLQGLSLAVGVAIIQSLHSSDFSHPLQLKWPNDIYADNKKLGGILIESVIQGETAKLVIGIGLNICMQDIYDNKIDQAWVDLQTLCADKLDRNQICSNLIDSLFKLLTDVENNKLNLYLTEWQKHDYLQNKKITINEDGKELSGIAVGINQHGELQVDCHGEIRTLTNATITCI